MKDTPSPRALNGGALLVENLLLQGADSVYCVPGESYLAVLDGLCDAPQMRVVTCRQEGGAAMMAEAYGKLTGRPAVCMVTRGPGATNASAGLHVAYQDSTPMILLIGQVARDQIEREAFQEIDYRRMFGQVAKWVAQIDDAARIPEFIARAFSVATSGRPGPVVLALPEDMLTDIVTSPPSARKVVAVEAGPSADDLQAGLALLASAARPMILLGGAPWDQAANEAIEGFAARHGLAVATTFRRADHFDNAHHCYVGDLGIGQNPALTAAIRDSDLLLVIGSRLSEMTTGGYSLIDIPCPAQKMIHIHPDASELGRVYQPDLAIVASPRRFVGALAKADLVANPAWATRTKALRASYLDWQKPLATHDQIQLCEVMRHLEDTLPPEAIYTNGAGNFSVWAHRFHQYRRHGGQLAPTSGSMGYGFPAAIAAAIQCPDRPVICFAGDGDFMMTSQELSTAMAQKAKLVVLIFNNGIYGTIRMHQERHYPGRVMATSLHNPDFAAFARSFGAFGETVRKTADFADAFSRAMDHDGPAVIELILDPDIITPTATLAGLRATALAGKS